MKNLKFLSVVLFSLILIFASCDVKKSDKGKEILAKASQNTVDQIDALVNSNFSDAIKGIFFIENPLRDNPKKMSIQDVKNVKNIGITLKNSLINRFPNVFNKKFGDTTFSLTPYFGTYTWQDTMWVYENTPSDKAIFLFPSPTSLTNDLRVEWSQYEEVKTTDGYYYPTVIYAEMFKDNKKIGLIDYTATWNLDFEYPTVLNTKVLLDPIKFKVEYTFTDNIATLDASIAKGMKTLDDINTEITFKNDSMNEITYVKGIFKTYDINSSINTGVLLKVDFDVNVEAIPDETTPEDINKNMTIELYASSGRLIGTVEAIDYEVDDCGIIVKYNDGTSETLCEYFDDISDAVERIADLSGLYLK